jgi:hypothetical protein
MALKEEKLEEYWRIHREDIYHLAEQWGISVILSLVEVQHGIPSAVDLFLEEWRKRRDGVDQG